MIADAGPESPAYGQVRRCGRTLFVRGDRLDGGLGLDRALLAGLPRAQARRHRLVARFQLRHAGHEFLDTVLIELDSRVGVLDRHHGSQAVGRLDHTGADIETLHPEAPFDPAAWNRPIRT